MTAIPESRAVRPGIVLFSLAMGAFAIGTNEFATMGLLPYFAAGLGIDEPTAGHVISAYALGVVVGAPFGAAIVARMSRRSALIWLMVFFAVGNLFVAIAPNYGSMMVVRFLSGLPHGAYFGVSALLAASLVPREKRAQAIARVMLGLTIATIIGVPVANAIGQLAGWRWGFILVAALGFVTAALIYRYAPRGGAEPGANPLAELGALKRRQVWLALAIATVGFGGLFASYAYLASTLLEHTMVSPAIVPFVLAIFGVGLTVGHLFAGWAADRALMPSIGGILLLSAAALAFYSVAIDQLWTIAIAVFLIGCGGGVGSPLQARLMDVAGKGQTLAAALIHSAFNAANALGPWLAGLAIAGGLGWASVGWVGCSLAMGGFAIWLVAVLDDRRTRRIGLARAAEAPAE